MGFIDCEDEILYHGEEQKLLNGFISFARLRCEETGSQTLLPAERLIRMEKMLNGVLSYIFSAVGNKK